MDNKEKKKFLKLRKKFEGVEDSCYDSLSQSLSEV